MEKTYFICDANNISLIKALKSVLSKLPLKELYFTPVVCDECKKLNTIDTNDGLEKVAETTKLLFTSFLNRPIESIVYVLDIKETIIFSRSDHYPQLSCVSSVLNEDMSKIGTAFNSIDLPPELQEQLISRKNIYEAINNCFEEQVTTKTDLYYYFTKKDKITWYEETLTKLLSF
jgi:hypothetical protein